MLRYTISYSALLILLAGFNAFSQAATCVAESTDYRVAMLELYTSEGCNSCPPADRWLNSLQDRGFETRHVVPLAFHVDYWDYIGWKDRFAQPEFSQRQRSAADHNKASVVYTPQFLLNGRDIRRPWLAGELSRQLQSVNGQAAQLNLRLQQTTRANTVHASLSVTNVAAQGALVYVALFENGLHSEIKAGENAGKKLYHEFVVRKLTEPLVVAPGKSATHQFDFEIPAHSEPSRLGLAAFAENAVSRATMQAMAMPLCDS